MNLRNLIHIVVSMLVLGRLGIAQTAMDEFERGNAHYRNGRFQEAVAAYESILKQGLASSALLYNLGNAYYRMGRIAPAILAYERALRLEPGDADIKHNLELANLKTTDRIEPLPQLFFVQWLRVLSAVLPITTTRWLFALCWIAAFGTLSAIFLLPHSSFIRALRPTAPVSFALSLLVGVLLIMHGIDARSRDDAIIMTSVVTAKTSPDAQSVDAFVIHEGLKVRLSDSVGEWVKITLADGKVGWVHAQECERI